MLKVDVMCRRVAFVLVCIVFALSVVPAVAVSKGKPNRLQSYLDDAVAQIELAYRQQPEERDRRQREIAAVIASWRAAPRSEENNERLRAWLRSAIASSMPGSDESLPRAPQFVANTKSEARGGETRAPKNEPAVPGAQSDSNPFRDDPKSAGN
jgi:hypothetical protein